MEKESLKSDTKFNLLDRDSFNVAIISVFSALTVLVGYLLYAIPNFELFSLMLFFCGFSFGKKNGLFISVISVTIFCFLNPMGPSHILLFATQISLYSILSLLGFFSFKYLKNKEYFKPTEDLFVLRVLILLGAVGFSWTFIYDIIATIGGYLPFIELSFEVWIPIFIAGIPFSVIHIVSNTLLYIFVLPAIIQISSKLFKISEF